MNSKTHGIAVAQRQVPSCAVVFYAKDNSTQSESQFATYHEVREEAGKFELAAGLPLTSENLKKVAQMVSVGLRHKTEILPECVLAVTDDLLVWWMPAQQQLMHFDVSMGNDASDRQRLQGVSGKMPLPALVFVLRRSRNMSAAYCGISVYALAENARPTGKTNLYRAPLLNTDSKGSVCWGSGLKPKGTAVADIAGWQSLFFSSVFTHYNGSAPIRGNDCYSFIADLLQSDASEFPLTSLIPMKVTLEKVLSDFSELNHG